jgi:hypothetical protein
MQIFNLAVQIFRLIYRQILESLVVTWVLFVGQKWLSFKTSVQVLTFLISPKKKLKRHKLLHKIRMGQIHALNRKVKTNKLSQTRLNMP